MRKSRSEQIFDYAFKFATPFSTTLGHPWAIISEGPLRYGLPVRSESFHEWLACAFQREYDLWPGCHAMRGAIRIFAAHASYAELPVTEVFTRVGWRGDRLHPESVLIHLANSDNESIEITPTGHCIANTDSWRFLAAGSTAPLPRPATSNANLVEQLQSLLGLSGAALHRAAIWLFAAMRPTGPYPVLSITGPPASGKSTLAYILRTLIDPSPTPLLSAPSKDRELFALALHNRVLAFDRVNSMPLAVLDCIARLAKGTGIGICSRNIFDRPDTLTVERPIILTASAPDRRFTSNAIHIALPAMKLENMRLQRSLAQRFEAAAPLILGTLCNAVSSALANISSTKAAPVSRCPDVHQWTLAAAPVLGLSTEQINRALAADPIIGAVQNLLESRSEWTGTATQLIKTLNLPLAPESLSEQLAALPLSLFGLTFERWNRHGKRQIRVAHPHPVAVTQTMTAAANSLS